MKNIKHIFFDLDHTLWDFEKNSSLTFKFLIKKYDLNVSLEHFLKIYMPINFSLWDLYRDEKITKQYLRYNRLKMTFEKLNIEVSDIIIDKISEDYIKHLPDNNFLLNNAVTILDYLYPKYKLHIITNGFHKVQHSKIINSGLDKYFDCIIDSESVGVKKPHSKIFQNAYKESNASSLKDCLMIGDNYEADIIGAADFGLQTIYFDYYNKSTYNDVIGLNNLKNINLYL